MAKAIQSQHDQRVSSTDNESGDFFTDQWGRSYHAEVEVATGHPCSPFRPDGWTAPLETPQNYMLCLRGRKSRGAKRENYDIRINYDQWIADWTKSGQSWDEEATKRTIAIYGAGWDRKAGFPPDVLLLVGARPGGKLDAVKAAKQGHPYVLGLEPFDPSKASDVKLQALLVPQAAMAEPDWMADHAPAVEQQAVKPRGRGKREAVAAGVSDEQWAEGEE